MTRDLERAGPLIGLTGSLIVATASVVTALAYSGSKGESFSPLNHWVSELGETGVSELAAVFNLGLIVGGVLFAVFIGLLGLTTRTRLAWLYALIGIAAGVAGAFVGIYPMDTLDLHAVAALAFFNLAWICVGLASIDFYRLRDPRFPRWVAIIGLLTVASFVGFMASLAPLLSGDGLGAPEVRPDFWIVPILEWGLVGGIILWTFATSLTWWRAGRGRAA